MPNMVLGRALFLGGKRVQQHTLARGLESAAGQALEHAKEDQLRQAGGHAAEPRGEGEDGDRHQEVVAAAEVGREPAGDRQDEGVGGQVAGDDPLAVDHRRRQPAGNVAQRHVGHRRVQHLHERRDDHGDGDDPGIDRRAADRSGGKATLLMRRLLRISGLGEQQASLWLGGGERCGSGVERLQERRRRTAPWAVPCSTRRA